MEEKMASPPVPVTEEQKDKTKAAEPSTIVNNDELDSDCKGADSPENQEKHQHQHEEKEKDPTDADTQETDSEKIIEESQRCNNEPTESTDGDEKDNGKSKDKDTDTEGDGEKEEEVKEDISNKDHVSDADDREKEDKVNDDTSVGSKLDAAALSASLSSSRCLLKRNRDDLDVDSDGDNKEEPECKKSHTAAAIKSGDKEKKSEEKDTEENGSALPVVVEKSLLSKAELVASMSSSKSVLKRSIDQVTESAEGSAAPDVKKSNIVSEKTDEEHCEVKASTAEPSSDPKTPVKPSRSVSNVSSINIPSPRMLIKSPSSPVTASEWPLPVLESTRLSPVKDVELSRDDEVKRSPKIPKEEVRMIAAKDLAEDRKLEKRRLNKLLAIFDDQKPVK